MENKDYDYTIFFGFFYQELEENLPNILWKIKSLFLLKAFLNCYTNCLMKQGMNEKKF